MKNSGFVILSLLIVLLLMWAGQAHATLGPGDKKKKTTTTTTTTTTAKVNTAKSGVEPPETQAAASSSESVRQRALVNKEIKSTKEIIKHHAKYCVECALTKTFKANVLGYVTPWNGKGYDVAKTFANKLDYVSPVWLQIKRKSRHNYELMGTHDIDAKWMSQVRASTNRSVAIVPRILFEHLRMEDVHALFNDEDEIAALGEMLVKKCAEHGFDGYVLEIYMQLNGHGKTQIAHIVTDVAAMLHDEKKNGGKRSLAFC
jgi:chitinase domain-containing protein 1